MKHSEINRESQIDMIHEHQKDRTKNYQSASLLHKYLTREISIDYKACAYFFCIFLYYCGYLLLQGIYSASILYLTEIFICTYIMSYLQVYLLWNFDEAERIGIRETVGMLLSTLLYSLAGFLLGWFGQDIAATIWFTVYLIIIFVSLFTANLIKRRIDTKELNQMLDGFKKGRE